jgi:hypothetical protein
MPRRKHSRPLALALALCACQSAWAHKPFFSYGHAPDPEHALVIRDIDLSQVVYARLTDAAPQCWLAFDAREGQTLTLQLGVPRIDRFRGLRPAMAVLGPGLPHVQLPFAAPQGLGGVVVGTADVREPRRFYEPFTGTRSWILRRVEIRAADAGRHYVVLYSPAIGDAKVWLAIGTRETLGLGDWLRLPIWIARVRGFHEVGGVPTWVAVAVGLVAVGAVVAF